MNDFPSFGSLKAAEYMRYSTDNQTENSIAYQQAKIRKYAAENNIQIVASFQDEAASGTNTDRRGFQALGDSENNLQGNKQCLPAVGSPDEPGCIPVPSIPAS